MPHNFLIDLICGDYEHDFQFGLELTGGSNLIDPIGYLHFPSNGDCSFFGGGDIHVGYKFDFQAWVWNPALRYSILFQDISVPECPQMEIILGNKFIFAKKAFLSVGGGIGIDSFYENNELLTRLKWIWAAQIALYI